MHKKITSLFLFGATLFLLSCATIICGSKQYVGVSSKPSVARIYIDGVEVGKTPFETSLKRNREYSLTITLDGYKSYNTVLRKRFNIWTVGNILNGLVGAPIGLGIDLATGAVYKLSPEEFLGEAGHMHYIEKNHGVTLFITLSPRKNGEKIGQMEKQREHVTHDEL